MLPNAVLVREDSLSSWMERPRKGVERESGLNVSKMPVLSRANESTTEMNPTLSVSIHDENNLGDRVCNPCDYFDELKDVRRWNAWDTDWMYSPSNIIVGGGGLVHEM